MSGMRFLWNCIYRLWQSSVIVESSLNSTWIYFHCIRLSFQAHPRAIDEEHKWTPLSFHLFAIKVFFNLGYVELKVLGLDIEFRRLPAADEGHIEIQFLGSSILSLFRFPSWEELLKEDRVSKLEKYVRHLENRDRMMHGGTLAHAVQTSLLKLHLRDARANLFSKELILEML